jgi:uncharacterized protein involved in exopolysaccharide biosynthesis
MTQKTDQEPAGIGSVDFRTLTFAVLRRWKIVTAGLVAGFLLAVIQLHLADTVYATQMTVTPVRPTGDANSGTSSLGPLGGLASLAGVSLPSSQNSTDFRLFIESLTSRDVANRLASDHALMKNLFADQWDEDNHSWHEPHTGFGHEIMTGLKSMLGIRVPVWLPPDAATVQEFVKGNIQILQDPKKTYLATIEFDSVSPTFAGEFLSLLGRAADMKLRESALKRASQYIDYLSAQLNTVTVAEHRQALMSSLSQQEQTAMAANSAVPYAADVFDSPSVAYQPVYPVARTIFEIDVAVGTVLGAALALVLHFWNTALRDKLLLRLYGSGLSRLYSPGKRKKR